MSEESGKYFCIAALLAAGLISAWTARACRRARQRGLPGSDAIVWAGLSLVFLLYAQAKLANVMGWLKGLGEWLRILAKQHHLYANRRPYQVIATVTVAVIVAFLLAIGIISMWDYIKRYRLAIGFMAIALGYGAIRFISLHEVDAWNKAMPWMRVVVEVTASLGASAVAIVRLRQLRTSTRPG